MHADLDTLVTALNVKVDDEIGGSRSLGRPPLLSDSELVGLAVAQALLGFHSESRCKRLRSPIMWTLANPKIGEREVLAAMLRPPRG